MITINNLHRWASSKTEEEFIEQCKAENKIEIQTGAYLRKYYATSSDDTLHSALVAFYRQEQLELRPNWKQT